MNVARIQEFRGIRDLSIPLSPTLTALVGPNGCGKSRVLQGMDASASTSGRICLYEFDPVQLAHPTLVLPVQAMMNNGFGLAAAIRHMQSRESDGYNERAADMMTAARNIAPELLYQLVRVEDDSEYAWLFLRRHVLSPSALLTLGIFAAVYSAKAGDLVLFENIEHGLYFRSLSKLVRELELACERLPGLQIVFSTHSMDLLDHLQPDQIRILSALEGGDVTCMSLPDHPEFNAWRDICSPGEIVSILGPR